MPTYRNWSIWWRKTGLTGSCSVSTWLRLSSTTSWLSGIRAASSCACGAEAARVLRPGGRLALADIVTESQQLPAGVSCDADLWAACIGGAMQVDDYRTAILRNIWARWCWPRTARPPARPRSHRNSAHT